MAQPGKLTWSGVFANVQQVQRPTPEEEDELRQWKQAQAIGNEEGEMSWKVKVCKLLIVCHSKRKCHEPYSASNCRSHANA